MCHQPFAPDTLERSVGRIGIWVAADVVANDARYMQMLTWAITTDVPYSRQSVKISPSTGHSLAYTAPNCLEYDPLLRSVYKCFINFIDESLDLCVYTILTNLLCVSIIDPQVNHVTLPFKQTVKSFTFRSLCSEFYLIIILRNITDKNIVYLY